MCHHIENGFLVDIKQLGLVSLIYCLIGIFRLFIFKVIIDRVGLISTIFVSAFLLCTWSFFFFPSFSAFSGFNWAFLKSIFICLHLFLTLLGLCCCVGFSLGAASRGHTLDAACRLLFVVASLVWEHGLWDTWASVVVASGLSCLVVCGISPDGGLNPCILHWQVGSLPLSHHGSPLTEHF